MLSSVISLFFLNELCMYLTTTGHNIADEVILMNSIKSIKIDIKQINLLNLYVAVCLRENQLLHVIFVNHNLCQNYLQW